MSATGGGLERGAAAGLRRWHELVENADAAGIPALLADDVVFHSPVVHTPHNGKKLVGHYLAAAFGVFVGRSFRYVREVASGHEAVLEFLVEIDGITVNGVDMITWNDAGQIIAFKVMLRPLQAIKLIHQKMTDLLQSAPNVG